MSKRKYRKGGHILSLDELARQEFVYWNDKITHFGWFQSWQFRLAINAVGPNGCVYYAIKEKPDKVVCNRCGRKFADDSELALFVETTASADDVYVRKYVRGVPLEDNEVVFKGCPWCRTDAYLMDLEEKK